MADQAPVAAVLDAFDTATKCGPKSKRRKQSKSLPICQISVRRPDWAYVHFQYFTSNTATIDRTGHALDAVTAHLHLTAALSSFLGVHGTAIPFDILKVEEQDVWIRVPAEDRAAVIAAAGGWISGSGNGWSLKGWSHWNAKATRQNDASRSLFQ